MGRGCQKQQGAERGEEQQEWAGLLAQGSKGLLDTALHCECSLQIHHQADRVARKQGSLAYQDLATAGTHIFINVLSLIMHNITICVVISTHIMVVLIL